MKNLFSTILSILGCLFVSGCVSTTSELSYHGEVLCSDQGTRNVYIMKHDGNWANDDSILWRWNPAEDDSLTANEKNLFGNPSDTKVVANGKKIVVVASGGAACLIDIATCKAEFLAAPRGNTHSADLLPDGSLVTASSTGSKLMVFTRKDQGARPHKSCTVPFKDAHGVVWDARRKVIWALGAVELASFTYNFDIENPQLTKVDSYTFDPSQFWGHDLVPVWDKNMLLLTGAKVLSFDLETRKMEVFSQQGGVKSISVHPKTGEVIVQIPEKSWSSASIKVLGAGKRWTKPKARFYKARWFFP